MRDAAIATGRIDVFRVVLDEPPAMGRAMALSTCRKWLTRMLVLGFMTIGFSACAENERTGGKNAKPYAPTTPEVQNDYSREP